VDARLPLGRLGPVESGEDLGRDAVRVREV
jgi:hypothetical protein